MARVKCKSCKKGINKNIAIPVFFEESKRNYYFCCEDCRISYFKKKQEELKQQKINELERQGLSLVYEYVRRELFGYTEKQQLPKSFITRLQDLRNGTMRGKSFHRQSKNGYDYEVIFETFKKNDKLVRYCLTNKLSSANESQKLNYIMAIIESKIKKEN
jgi:hypothetical protein